MGPGFFAAAIADALVRMFIRFLVVVGSLVGFLLLVATLLFYHLAPAAHASEFLRPTGVEMPAPPAQAEFCARHGAECMTRRGPAKFVIVTPQVKALIDRINHGVNDRVLYRSDEEHWGVADRWDYAEDGEGDCEDMALLKQRLLTRAGLPRTAFLLTVVVTLAGEGHMVLTVRTDMGDFLLDSMTNSIIRTDESTHVFIKRQDPLVPTRWLQLDGPRGRV